MVLAPDIASHSTMQGPSAPNAPKKEDKIIFKVYATCLAPLFLQSDRRPSVCDVKGRMRMPSPGST